MIFNDPSRRFPAIRPLRRNTEIFDTAEVFMTPVLFTAAVFNSTERENIFRRTESRKIFQHGGIDHWDHMNTGSISKTKGKEEKKFYT